MARPEASLPEVPTAQPCLRTLSSLSPRLALAVTALLSSTCDVPAVAALTQGVYQAALQAAQGSVTASSTLDAILAVPMTPNLAEQYEASRRRRSAAGGAAPPAPHAAAATSSVGAVVWVALQLCQDVSFQHQYTDAHAPVISIPAAYNLLGMDGFCRSAACSRHLVQLPEVHAMIASHLDAWLQDSSCPPLGFVRRQAAGAMDLLVGLLQHGITPAPGCHPGQHMARLVSAMRPSLRECAMTESIGATAAVAHLAVLYPSLALEHGAGAAVLQHVLYTPDLCGIACPAALRILAAELAHADAEAQAGAAGGDTLVAALQRRLVGHALRGGLTLLWQSETSLWERDVGSDLLLLSRWAVGSRSGGSIEMLSAVTDSFNSAVLDARSEGDTAALQRLDAAVARALRCGTAAVRAWLTKSGMVTAAVAAAVLAAQSTAPASQGCADTGGSSSCSHAGTVPPEQVAPRVCAGRWRGCVVLEGVEGQFEECPHCFMAYHSDACMAADRYGSHARCTLTTLLEALPWRPHKPSLASKIRPLLGPLGHLLRSETNPHLALTAEVTAQVVSLCSDQGLSVPEHLCTSAASFWKRSAAATTLHKDDATMLALHATIFGLTAQHASFAADEQLAACLVTLGLNRPTCAFPRVAPSCRR